MFTAAAIFGLFTALFEGTPANIPEDKSRLTNGAHTVRQSVLTTIKKVTLVRGRGGAFGKGRSLAHMWA
jgi:hypothetical protein